MIAGRLTEKVQLLLPEEVVDGYGSKKIVWSEGPCVRAEVQWKSGNTALEDSELFAGNNIEVLIRWREVKETWRLVYDGTLYDIDAIALNRHKGFKRLICSKVNE